MQLKGSCHCGAVKFRLQADSPVPFMHCYCTICRKTAGGGGYAINLGGDVSTTAAIGQELSVRVATKLLRSGHSHPLVPLQRGDHTGDI